MGRISYIFVWLIYFLMTFSFGLYAQSYSCVEPSDRALKLYDKAVDLWNTDNTKAKKLFYDVIEMEPQWVAPFFFMAKSYYLQTEIIQYDTRKVASLDRLLNAASDFFEKVVNICIQHENYSALYYLGKIYYTGGNLVEAHNYLKKYISRVGSDEFLPRTLKMYERTEVYKFLIDNPVDFKPIAVAGVCSSDDEFMPMITPDGGYMFLTRKVWKKLEARYSPELIEEFCSSRFLKWDSFGNPVFDVPNVMKYPFNQGLNQGAAAITIDNQRMLITMCEQIEMPDGRPYKNCDIFETRKLFGSWTAFERLGNGVNGITTWEGHPTVSSDGLRLYFASYRPGGIGGIDIYFSSLDSTGHWGAPTNMGNPINSKLNERAPFIHPDGRTLYFASDGHDGVGGYDIFLARFQDSVWQDPINIGYPINSEDDESGFIVTTNGNYAFFSSNAYSGFGGYDILGFELPESIQPGKMLFVRGKLIDGNGAILRDASVEIKNVKSQETRVGMVDNSTGKYSVTLPAEVDDYIIMVKKPNHVFTTRYISTSDSLTKRPNVEFNFVVPEAKVGVGSRISDILFPSNSTELSDISIAILNEFATYLIENSTLRVRIEGHTDNIADEVYNRKLSEKRALKVYKYIIKHGVNKRRLDYQGYGASKPIMPNDSEAGRAENRRTEFVIIGKN